MEVKPLKNLYELVIWEEDRNLQPQLDKLIPLQPRSSAVRLPSSDSNQLPYHFTDTKTLLCHDLYGGYHDDRFCNGTKNFEAYRFYQWSGIDTFVYFSHYLVTIPPCGWIEACHLHGVKVLGTFITEWDAGAHIWEEILEDEEITEAVITNLVKIASCFKIEGWLLNVENKIKPEKISLLIDFVKKLTVKMRAINAKSEVIWYDSVTEEGKLEWQNELNCLNQCFFDVCDGIFLNYCWTEKNLIKTLEMAGERRTDVYVGVDLFSRNCDHHGGGFSSYKELQTVAKYQLSCAFFSQSWTYEKLGPDEFFMNENRMWRDLAPWLWHRGTAKIPFSSSFCQGFGKKLFKEGKVVNSGSWYNLSEQQIQPLWSELSHAGVPFSYSSSDAYNGGSCLAVWIDVRVKITLFLFEIPIDYPMELIFMYKISGLLKVLLFEVSIQLDDAPQNEWKEVSFICEKEGNGPSNEERNEDWVSPSCEEEKNSWKLK